MAVSNLKSLIGKLNETCRSALESAAGLCLSQTHYDVDIEHFLIKLLEMSDTDILKILKHFEVNDAHLVADLTRAIESFKTGNARDAGTVAAHPADDQRGLAARLGGVPDPADPIRTGPVGPAGQRRFLTDADIKLGYVEENFGGNPQVEPHGPDCRVR